MNLKEHERMSYYSITFLEELSKTTKIISTASLRVDI
jgi:hypothetical protein